jgi:hypothetical protein
MKKQSWNHPHMKRNRNIKVFKHHQLLKILILIKQKVKKIWTIFRMQSNNIRIINNNKIK